MKVALLGSTGFVGKALLGGLLDAGHEVNALVRDPAKLGAMAGRVAVLQGDFFRSEDVDAVIEGAEAVVSTIGPSKNEMSAEFSASCVAAMSTLVRAMEQRGPTRLIFMAGAAMPLPGEKLNPLRRAMEAVIRMVAGKAWEGKVAEMREAFAADLDVTVVRPPMITRGSRGSLHIHETRLGGVSVGVGQVAGFMVDELSAREWIGKAPVVWSGKAAGGPRC